MDRQNIILSIIVPIYNSECTLAETLEAIMQQTLWSRMPGRIELVLINDASVDRSMDIINGYKKKYPDEIKIINLIENHGPGGARNYGLDIAEGMYIGFSDSDDVMDSCMFEKMIMAVSAGKRKPDYVDCGILNEADHMLRFYTPTECSGVLDHYKRERLISDPGYLMSRIYRREFLNRNGIRFREHAVMEDMDFLCEVIAKAEIVCSVEEPLYLYKDTPGSASKRGAEENFFENTIKTIDATYHKLVMLKDYHEIQNGTEYLFWTLYIAVMNTLDGYEQQAVITKELADRLRNILNQKMEETTSIEVRSNLYVLNKMNADEIAYIEKNIKQAE